jgi:hypothetical protein
MKVLLVSGEDFSALHFENHYKGQKVSDIIQSGITQVDEEDDVFFEMEVIEIGVVSDEFIKFIRTEMIDYDHGKDKNFWLETETV